MSSMMARTVRPVAPNLHFLTGKALQRLKDADTVVYVASLRLFTVDQMLPLRERPGKFAVSYDILEEKFKAVLTESGERSKAGMTASQAETWCLDSLSVSAAGLAPDRPFFLRLEMRAAGPKEEFSNVMADPFRAVVEILSRKAGPGEQHWGPLESRPRAPLRPGPHAGPGGEKRVNRLRNRLILIFLAATWRRWRPPSGSPFSFSTSAWNTPPRTS